MPDRRAPASRAARRGCLAGSLAVLVLLGLAVGAVVLALNTFTARTSNSCVVELADGSREVLDADQADNAALLAAVAVHRDLPARAVTIAVATALQESKLRNIDYGDRDSVGLFQQRPSQGWGTVEEIMDPVYATNAFYDVLVTVQGWEGKEITDAAQEVQRSAFPDAYARHEARGRAFASALTGYSPGTLVCRLDPVGSGGTTGSGPAGPAVAGAVRAALSRDFVTVDVVDGPGGAVVVDATSLPAGLEPAPGRRAWAVAQWAVATASRTGASWVVTDGRAWSRADGDGAAWTGLDEVRLPAELAAAAAELPAGSVLVA